MNVSSQNKKDHAMLQWLNHHRSDVLRLYKNQYIAYDEQGVIAHGEDLKEVLATAGQLKEDFLIYLVPPQRCSAQILPIYFRSVARHEWQPNYCVILKHNQIEIKASLLVDSGAELSLISQKLGEDLGYSLADAESKLSAETIGGKVEYVLRNIEMIIDGHHLVVPTAWLQTPVESEQLLLGREVVFDQFNIEFRQADEQIIFNWRGEANS
ncbi:MAG: hypothetical protein BRC33_11115 [Cyanobacteria bacterium SW_9_44_58]|nr:MAG: hypothetical protein BRC33_11115 [Cyanobacteria bacterium SW_9_44_58]